MKITDKEYTHRLADAQKLLKAISDVSIQDALKKSMNGGPDYTSWSHVADMQRLVASLREIADWYLATDAQ